MKRTSGKIKVLVIDDPKIDGVGWWRNLEPFTALEKMYGANLEIIFETEKIDLRKLKAADVVVRFRPITANAFDFLEMAKNMGCKVIVDIDDDLWHLPPSHPGFGDWMKHRDNLRRVYEVADKIWVSTEQLRYAVGDLERCEVMQNAVLPEQLPEHPMPYKGIAAWRGNDRQVADILDGVARTAYWEAREKYEQWIFFGYFPDLPHFKNAKFVPGVDPLVYFLSLQNDFANVLWKPLQQNLFNDSKSNIAWIEATMSGGVCVTNYAGKPGWEFALADFPTDEATVHGQFYLSREHILKHYNLLEVTERRFKSITELVK